MLVVALLSAPAFADSKPNPEIANVAKVMTGAWKCEVSFPGMPQKVSATVKSELTLDGRWIHETVDVAVPGSPIREEAYMTFDGTKWQRWAFDNSGEHETGSADPMKNGKLDWTVDEANVTQRVHIDASDTKKGLHLSIEMSKDKAKTWSPGPDLICKK
jgi:hypothetical protein